MFCVILCSLSSHKWDLHFPASKWKHLRWILSEKNISMLTQVMCFALQSITDPKKLQMNKIL